MYCGNREAAQTPTSMVVYAAADPAIVVVVVGVFKSDVGTSVVDDVACMQSGVVRVVCVCALSLVVGWGYDVVVAGA